MSLQIKKRNHAINKYERLWSGIRGEPAVTVVTDEPAEFEKSPVEVHQDYYRQITDHFRGMYRIYYPNLMKENMGMSTCNHRLDLGTLGSQPVIYAQKSIYPTIDERSSNVGCEKTHMTSDWFVTVSIFFYKHRFKSHHATRFRVWKHGSKNFQKKVMKGDQTSYQTLFESKPIKRRDHEFYEHNVSFMCCWAIFTKWIMLILSIVHCCVKVIC